MSTTTSLKPMTSAGVKSSWYSKINWTQIVSFLASILVVFGIDMPAETQVALVAGIQGAQSAVTWILRTWFTKDLTTASVDKMAA